MKQVVRLRDRLGEPGEVGHAAQLLRTAAPQPFPAAQREKVWRGVVRAPARPAQQWLAALALVALAVAATATAGLLRTGRIEPKVPAAGADASGLEPASGAQVRRISPGEVALTGGALRGRRQGSPLVVSTRHLSALFVDAAFLVETTETETFVTVYEGSGSVRRPGGAAIEVSPGHTVRSQDLPAAVAPPPVDVARLASLVPPATAGRSTACGHAGSVAGRRKCLERVAVGNGLAGENALFALGLFDRDEVRDGNAAVRDWQAYLARFEEGVFAPEARLAVIAELVAQGRDDEALDECEAFRLRFAEDLRSGDVALVQGLLRARRGQPERALEHFARAAQPTSSPAAREEALFQAGLWSEKLGDVDAARRAWRELVAQFPGGARAIEAASHLADLEAPP